jgi:Flp pilus assembly pilin Flp
VFLVPRREEGQGLAEYALILSLIAFVVVVILGVVGVNLTQLFSMIANKT